MGVIGMRRREKPGRYSKYLPDRGDDSFRQAYDCCDILSDGEADRLQLAADPCGITDLGRRGEVLAQLNSKKDGPFGPSILVHLQGLEPWTP